MRKLFAFMALCASSAFAQFDIFTISQKVTLTAETTALSVQLPSGRAFQAEIIEATAQCSATCNVQMESNGDAAAANGSTILAVTPAALNPETTPASVRASPNIAAFVGSGIPAGTAVSPAWTIPAGGLIPFGGGRVMAGAGGGINYILRLTDTSYTGDVTLYFAVRVRR